MNHLPLESPDWREDFKSRISLEHAVLKTLIEWGFTESAFDVYRMMEERFNDALESQAQHRGSNFFRLPEKDKAWVGEILREYYLRTREIPRRRSCQERLHNALLAGFEELTGELVLVYERYLRRRVKVAASEQAA